MLHPRPKRLLGDNALLRAHFREVFASDPNEDRITYARWLRAEGIDPDSGRMTAEGLAFFRSVIEEANARNRSRRVTRRPQRRAISS
jgi:hypothetical protein